MTRSYEHHSMHLADLSTVALLTLLESSSSGLDLIARSLH